MTAAVANVETNDVQANKKSLTGDFAMWIFILNELTVFAVLFFVFKGAEVIQAPVFKAGKENLSISIGLICTLALITSSYFVALSVSAVKKAKYHQAKWLILLALVASAGYLITKSFEYNHLLSLGFGLSSDDFYALYFLVTGFHFLHVLFGIVILIYMMIKCHLERYHQGNISGFEAGASYWHMVDLLWVIVFYLIYLSH